MSNRGSVSSPSLCQSHLLPLPVDLVDILDHKPRPRPSHPAERSAPYQRYPQLRLSARRHGATTVFSPRQGIFRRVHPLAIRSNRGPQRILGKPHRRAAPALRTSASPPDSLGSASRPSPPQQNPTGVALKIALNWASLFYSASSARLRSSILSRLPYHRIALPDASLRATPREQIHPFGRKMDLLIG
jgi:hypothetical protein